MPFQEETLSRCKTFFSEMNKRRTLRFFSQRPVPREVVEEIIKTAGTAPSGAHTEPWTYVVVRIKDEIYFTLTVKNANISGFT